MNVRAQNQLLEDNPNREDALNPWLSRFIFPKHATGTTPTQLTSLSLTRDNVHFQPPGFAIHQVIDLLSQHPNLENLTLTNVMVATMDRRNTPQIVHLSRLRTLRLTNYGDAPSCTLGCLRIPSSATVDIEVTSPTQPFYASLLVHSISGNLPDDECQHSTTFLSALTIRVRNGQIILGGYYHLPSMEILRDANHRPQLRTSFTLFPNCIDEVINAMTRDLPILRVQTLLVDDVLISQLSPSVLSDFLGMLPNLEVLYWTEVVATPLVPSRDFVIKYDRESNGNRDVILAELLTTLQGDVLYFGNLRKMFYISSMRGLTFSSIDRLN